MIIICYSEKITFKLFDFEFFSIISFARNLSFTSVNANGENKKKKIKKKLLKKPEKRSKGNEKLTKQ